MPARNPDRQEAARIAKERKREADRRYQTFSIERKRLSGREWARRNKQSISEKRLGQRATESQAYYASNRDEILRRNKEYRLRNAQQIRESVKARRAQNREELLRQKKEYYQSSKNRRREAINSNTRNRRAKLKRLPGKHTAAQIKSLYDQQNGKCAGCEVAIASSGPGRFQVDHILPIALFGSNDISNLQLLCAACNRQKGAKHPSVWRSEVMKRVTP